MGVYINGMKLDGRPHKALFTERDGKFVLVVETQYSFSDKEIKVYPVEELPPHGRLIDESIIDLSKYENAAHDALHNGKGSILYDSGVLAGARAITQLVRRAPAIIEAEEGELDG